MSPSFQRAASSVFVKALRSVSVKHPLSGCLRSVVLVQKGGSADGQSCPHVLLLLTEMRSPHHPSKYAKTCHMRFCGLERPTLALEKSIFLILWVQQPSPGRAGQAELCSSLTCSAASAELLTCSVASADLSPLQAVFYCRCPWGCQIFKLNPHAACFV